MPCAHPMLESQGRRRGQQWRFQGAAQEGGDRHSQTQGLTNSVNSADCWVRRGWRIDPYLVESWGKTLTGEST